ncbi:hypothetical protein BHF71_06350 [Vulcanibacillus modesticaldus]|uniref:ATP-grasp domain-containing protein n=1 Tax=Vulcanibacillus modesticaldus TaxID=337097 RepID=A0A1D2YWR6_9BACI|nr:YheC/YheD family protein [Vulcanibacillus modesticaldus]OEG00063.1 hypothetical protein BHF71_06350 [Vulcanibacillus modesticaldus]
MEKALLLGIMVCKTKNLFSEKDFYKLLQKAGEKLKIIVYVFYPNQIDWKTNKVKGFQYNFSLNKWEDQWFPLPDFIYDRCFYSSSHSYLAYKPYIKKLKEQKKIRFLGNGLKGKWSVYKILSSNPEFIKYLPKTAIYNDSTQLFQWLADFPIVLKPTGGSHGKGIIKIDFKDNNYQIVGRDINNNKINQQIRDQDILGDWVNLFIDKRSYLIQQYLDLITLNNEPYDIRVLVQKNQYGKWEITGSAVRIGDAANITSNLHGGGQVQNTESLLIKQFGKQKAKEILKQIKQLAESIPSYIESVHGNLFELGLDLGVDLSGKVWIIEANSKPGRKVFSLLGKVEERKKSLIQPLVYTKHLAKTIDSNNFN